MYQLLFMMRNKYQGSLVFEWKKVDNGLYELAITNLSTIKKIIKSATSLKQLAWIADKQASYYESNGWIRNTLLYGYKDILKELQN